MPPVMAVFTSRFCGKVLPGVVLVKELPTIKIIIMCRVASKVLSLLVPKLYAEDCYASLPVPCDFILMSNQISSGNDFDRPV